jgi:branched-chain amino acid transport system substrate-binding protein
VISALAANNPDIVAVGGHDTILINVVKAMKAQGFTPKALIQHYGVTEPAFVQALGKDADGCCGLVDWDPSFPYKDALFGSAAEAAKRYKDEHKVEMDYTGAGCAASALVLQLAFQKLGKPPGLSAADRVKLNDLIAATNLHTFYGPIKFEQSGPHFHDNTQPPPILIQIQNGQITAVAPSGVAHAKLVYPLKSL